MENVDPLVGILFPYINFAIFLGLAIYFFKKPALAAAAKGRAEFEALLAEARRAKTEAEAQLAELDRRWKGLDDEVRNMKEIAQKAAEAEAQKIIEDAERLAAHLREEAKRIADAEVAKARNGLRAEIVAAVRDSVTNKLRNDLDRGAHLKLVRERIEDLQQLPTT